MSFFHFQHATPDYLERQVGSQCASHAINHVLQEQKVVKVRPPFVAQGVPVSGKFIDKATGTVAPDNSSPLESGIQLNLWEICDEFDVLQAIQSGFNDPANFIRNADPQERCDAVHENLPFEGLAFILSELNYKTEFTIDTPTTLASQVAQAVQSLDVLGVILNLGGGHYTALSKYLTGQPLWKLQDGVVSIENVAYIESIPDATGQVQVSLQPVTSLARFLNSLHLYGCIYVYASENAYPSVAMERYTLLTTSPYLILGGGGTRKRTKASAKRSGASAKGSGASAKRRATKRRSHRKRKHTQRRR